METQDTLLPDLQEVSRFETLDRERLVELAKFQQFALAEQRKQIEKLMALVSLPVQEKLAIRDQLLTIRRKFYGQSSEKRPSPEPSLDRGGKKDKNKEPKVLLPSQRYPELALVEEALDFDASQIPECPHCQGPLQKMKQTEDAEYVTVTQKVYHIVRQERAKYCCTKCHEGIVTVPSPPRLKPGSSWSDEVAIDVAVAKYADHLPIERYVKQAERCGLESVQPQTLIDQTHYLADALAPLYERIKAEVKDSAILQADETPWKMLEGDDKMNWFMWGFFNEHSAFYSAQDTRAAHVAEDFLKGCQAKYLVSDAYSGYAKCTKDTPIKNVYCNAHARRKWIEAEPDYPEAKPMIEMYQELYVVEREIKEQKPAEKLRQRQERSKPILDRMKEYLFKLRALPKSSLGMARQYHLDHWTELTRFLEDGRIPIDNNRSERGLRGPVLGRKNFYGNHSKRGAKTTAVLYSVIESCKLNGVEPQGYLRDAIKAILSDEPFFTPAQYAQKFQTK